MPVAVLLANHTLLSLAALCACTVAAEVMTLKLKPTYSDPLTPAGAERLRVIGERGAR
jgi:hypothetical protein